jgi:predicted nucleotidyltransferase
VVKVLSDVKEVVYDSAHWMVLQGLRGKAVKIMDALAARSLSSAVYGSVARGDVNKKSDVDVIIPYTTSSHTVELALQMGGLQQVEEIKTGKRVPGCDKKLRLIQPTQTGHAESPIRGREWEVARIVGVGVAIVEERIRVLTRREKVGRTGIVFSRDLEEDEVFEEALKQVADTNPIVRRRLARK